MTEILLYKMKIANHSPIQRLTEIKLVMILQEPAKSKPKAYPKIKGKDG